MTAVEMVPGVRLRDDVIRNLAIDYGIPANPVTFATTAAEAASFAAVHGRPVAVKLVAHGVVHKSKSGGVLLGLEPDEVGGAVERLFTEQEARGVSVIGVTVEPMIAPGLEVVVGALHDPNFGPIVMVGTGGVDVETVGDFAFAPAPLDRDGAFRLLDRTRVGAVLRQRFAASHSALADLLVRVGGSTGLLLSEPIDQIDFNPIVVGPDEIVAVDARAITRDHNLPRHADLPVPYDVFGQLRPAIYPSSLAIVGASADPAKMGHRAVKSAIEQGFEGALYPVSRSSSEILGRPAVGTIAELPEGVDRAVVTLPAAAVPDALRELAKRGTKSAHVYTSDTEDLSDVAAGTGMRVLGPNALGLYTPYSRLTMIGSAASSNEVGSIAVISQSGTYAGDVIRRGQELGIKYSFVASIGNCDDVTPSEYLAFCEADPATTLAAFYLEDDSDAHRFFALAKRVTKPVVLFKGGRSVAGGAAASSHTGALASDPRLLRDAAAASGVVLVESIEELLDTLMVAQYTDTFVGKQLGIVGGGGGVAVVGADTAHENGLTLPPVSTATQDALSRFRAPGVNLSNPVDISIWSLYDETGPFTGSLVEALALDPAIDCLCAYLDLGTAWDIQGGTEAAELITMLTRDMLTANRGDVTMVMSLRSSLSVDQDSLVRHLRTVAAEHGVALLESVDRAIAALGRVRAMNLYRAQRSTHS
ncbi:acetate--CoA ligase family protein [Rhodococcoides fascians]|uniref:acetate--CoA ligase family protein n=1 Tax=Rhodococcoides fascians TaxID=1828 RepID=UPI000AD62B06|nr:acetate--CoA ligase family protein [Rhodococcus fascians]